MIRSIAVLGVMFFLQNSLAFCCPQLSEHEVTYGEKFHRYHTHRDSVENSNIIKTVGTLKKYDKSIISPWLGLLEVIARPHRSY